MTVHQLSGPPSPALARALAEFEVPFTYPLGPGKFFRISHGEDYGLFFRAQGEGSSFIAERGGSVAGTLGAAIRQLWLPDDTERRVGYVGDLKISARARGGTVLFRLARAAEAWLRPKVESGFSVVMQGTSVTPQDYTGRAGIPRFEEIGRLAILRVAGGARATAEPERFRIDAPTGLACYRRLSLGRYACPAFQPEARSQMPPTWLMGSTAEACGMLEDTRNAKRLIADDGSELLSAHLSCFAYGSIAAGAELVGAAVRLAERLGFPALFVSVSEPDGEPFGAALSNFEVRPAPASVYGTGLIPGLWNINTAEI
jgi:hypothetical protein